MKANRLFLIAAFAVLATVAIGYAVEFAPIAGGAAMLASVPMPLAAITDEAGRINVHQARPMMAPDGSVRVLVANAEGIVTHSQIVTNAPGALRHEQWRDIDREVVRAGAERLVGIADLEARGLVHNLGSIGVTISSYEKVSEMTGAQVSMDGITEGEKDTPNFDIENVPVPIVHKDFDINERRLIASRAFGEGVDVTAAGLASRNVSEQYEDMLFSGDLVKIKGGGTVYGYLNHPNRNTIDMDTVWGSATPAEIVDDIRAMAARARADHYYGPYDVYIPGPYQEFLDRDYLVGDPAAGLAGSTKTIRQRILELSDINSIKVADRLTGDNVVLVQLTRDVVDLAKAQGVTTVNWQAYGGMQTRFKVMGVQVPRVKSTYDGESGVVHLRPAG